jgi:N-acetylmuramic acid 6-phosphate etherase
MSQPWFQLADSSSLMAGGDSAIRNASEGAEDSETQPLADLEALEPPLSNLDTLIGIATSGRTPYVLAGLSHCYESLGMLTVGISCVKPSGMRGRCECLIECLVGPEILTGSTRMKAGTATKMVSMCYIFLIILLTHELDRFLI